MLEAQRLIVLLALLAAVGGTLLLQEIAWFRRRPLATRLLNHAGVRRTGVSQTTFIDDVVNPWLLVMGDRLSAVAGERDGLSARLERAQLTIDPSHFRLRQFAYAGAAAMVGLALMAVMRPPLPVIALFVLGGPLLVLLVFEQHVLRAIRQRQQQTFEELPLIAEQIAMLLGAGYSTGSALNRVSERLDGVAARDLRRVTERSRHGLTLKAALEEWSQSVDLPELHRLVAVLTLTESNDLGRLVSDQAEAIRRESQRRLVELIERRSQQVWIPVTVATLIPGVIFLCIPFLQALQMLSGT